MPIEELDRQHLLGEHCELHCVVNSILRGKGRYFNHPQTNRFKDRLGMLIDRHTSQIFEMRSRGYRHDSPLPSVVYYTAKAEDYTYAKTEAERDRKVLKERQNK